VYPTIRGLTWPIKQTPKFNNAHNPADNAYDVRVAYYANPVWEWVLKYAYILDDDNDLLSPYTASDWKTLVGFLLRQKMSFGSFLFLNPTDNTQLGAPLQKLQDELGTFYSPLQRTIGTSGLQATEDLTDFQSSMPSGGVVLYENGSPVTTAHSIEGPGLSLPAGSFDGMYVLWNAEPSAPITADLYWYNRVRFDKDDEAELDWFLGSPNRFLLDGLTLVTDRKGPLI